MGIVPAAKVAGSGIVVAVVARVATIDERGTAVGFVEISVIGNVGGPLLALEVAVPFGGREPVAAGEEVPEG